MTDAAAIHDAAQRLLDTGEFGESSLRDLGTVNPPLTVQSPDGSRHSWFVPITVRERLAAFMQFNLQGELLRTSSFQHRQTQFADCPLAADWLDKKTISIRAATVLEPGETVGEPMLSYDRSPERLAWSVPVTRGDRLRRVFVIGDVAYAHNDRKGTI